MLREDYIKIFNNILKNQFNSSEYINIVSEYLTEIKVEKANKLINLIVQNPQLMLETVNTIVPHYCNKYHINHISIPTGVGYKTILYL